MAAIGVAKVSKMGQSRFLPAQAVGHATPDHIQPFMQLDTNSAPPQPHGRDVRVQGGVAKLKNGINSAPNGRPKGLPSVT